MFSKRISNLLAVASILVPAAYAQSSVPADLKSAFEDGTGVQVSYTQTRNIDGFSDGATLPLNQVSKTPGVALGDSTGVNTAALFVIAMFDTTCDNARTLHFLQSDFKATQIQTDIASEAAPLLAYKAPGAFTNEKGRRKYTYLLYRQRRGSRLDASKIPQEGAVVDVQKLEKDLGLPQAAAGVSMLVELGGQADCNGQQQPNNPPPSSTVVALTSSSTARGSVPSSTIQAPLSSSVGSVSSSSASTPSPIRPSTSLATPTTFISSRSIPISLSSTRFPSNSTITSSATPSDSAPAPTETSTETSTEGGTEPEPSTTDEPEIVITSTQFVTPPRPTSASSSGVATQTGNGADMNQFSAAKLPFIAAVAGFFLF